MLLSSAGMFLDGFDLTVIAVANPVVQKQWSFSPFEVGLTASAALIGAFVGAMLMGRLADHFGRKRLYLIDLVGFVVFAGLAALSPGIWFLIITRFLLGVCIGGDYPLSATLTAEFGAKQNRGRLVVALSVMWNVGAVTAYATGALLLPAGDNSWRYMLLLGAVLAVVVLLLRARIPESPRWLIRKGETATAEKIVNDLVVKETGQPGGIALRESDFADETEDNQTSPQEPKRTGRMSELFRGRIAWATFFVSMFWFSHGVAYYGIQMYTPTVLGPLTGSSTFQSYVGSAIISALGVGGGVITLFLVESAGRRPLLLTAFIGESIALTILALVVSPPLAIVVILFGAGILFSNMGPGTLDLVYCTELFPTHLRSAGTGVGTAVSRVGSILGVLVFPTMVSGLGFGGALWLFASVALFGLVVTILLAPETKNKTLEETWRAEGLLRRLVTSRKSAA